MKNVISKNKFHLIGLGLVLLFFHQIFRRLKYFGTADFDQHVAWGEAARISILNYFQFPHFNPWNCGGVGLFSNYQSRFISPFFMLELIFGSNVGLKLSFIIAM